ncbi:TetR/AcrR family transcriptional regulator [Herbaspirillum sp. B65]|uniref:TetR/AcrR family transcriptional regulator n=1 Tax=Herbaspirillum sp. B65 TaxID=137708 RepID=UPI002110781D|nr:TetR/AcrR family transcriptional regulator [Herbaspirillum sp. B65]
MIQVYSEPGAARRRPGRPRNPESRVRLLDAGRMLILKQGLDFNIESIAVNAGVARRTFYSYFEDKEAFVAELLRDAETAIGTADDELAGILEKPLAEALYELGIRYLKGINQRTEFRWARLLASANKTYPRLVERISHEARCRDHALLTRIVEQAMASGKLISCDPAQAAGDIVGLWHGVAVWQRAICSLPTLSHDEIDRRVRRGVHLFLCIYEP